MSRKLTDPLAGTSNSSRWRPGNAARMEKLRVMRERDREREAGHKGERYRQIREAERKGVKAKARDERYLSFWERLGYTKEELA
jgi:hypothetical protein